MQALFKSLLLVVALSSAGVSAAEAPVKPQSPIKDVTPYVSKDVTTVVAFIKFNCPSCRMYHAALSEWGRTLPKGFSIQFYPVVEFTPGGQITDESLLGLQAFWVSEKLGNRQRKELFVDDAYSLSQDEMLGGDKDRWFKSLSTFYRKKDVISAWQSELKFGDARFQRQFHYEPTETPTLVVCGKWMFSIEAAKGDQNLFAQLSNGLVSRCADEIGIKIR